MNIYKQLNICIQYIEEHLTDVLDYGYISKIFGCSEKTIQNVFSLMTGMTITEYVKRRKLTRAIADIQNNEKIMDVAIKYGYSSDISFSRAFKKMHGVLPSKVKQSSVVCNMQLILYFDEREQASDISYRIETIDEFNLYGIKESVEGDIPPVATEMWSRVKRQFPYFSNCIRYGIIEKYGNYKYYYCATTVEDKYLEKVVIPRSKWIVFKSNSMEGKLIKNLFLTVNRQYLPSVGISSRKEFCLEKYYSDYMEIYIMIDE